MNIRFQKKIFNLLRIKEPLSYSDYLELKPKEFKYIKRLLNIPPKERNVNYLDKINFYIFNHLQEDFLLDLKKSLLNLISKKNIWTCSIDECVNWVYIIAIQKRF